MKINEEILLNYLNNSCTEEDLSSLNQWLSESEENRELLISYEAIYKSKNLQRYNSPDFVQARLDRFYKRLECEMKSQTKVKRNSIKKWMQYAAIITGLAVVSVTTYLLVYNDIDQLIVENNEDVQQLFLPDGTKVWLNKSAQLKYPEKFDGKTRSVYLEGEAYFEIVHNSDQPFIVETSALEVTVTGTTFNINSSSQSEVASVTLIEGEVRVHGKSNEGLLTLLPGQRAELNRTTRKIQVVESQHAELDGLWRDGLIPFQHASIGQIANILEKLYKVNIHLTSDISQTTYSGVLKKHDSIYVVLRSLKNSIPIKYSIEGSDVYISNN